MVTGKANDEYLAHFVALIIVVRKALGLKIEE